jgi:hypothetical protein
MKKIILFLVVLLTIFAAMAMDYVTGYGTQMQWELLRSQADEDPNAAIGSIAITTATAGDYWSKPTAANGIKEFTSPDGMSSDATAIGIAACAGSAADKTFTVNIWLWRKNGGPAQKVCSIAYTTGLMQVIKYPHNGSAATSKFWADTAVVTSTWFEGKIDTADADAGDRLAVVLITLYGEGFIYAEVASADGATGTEAGDVSVYMFKVSGG